MVDLVSSDGKSKRCALVIFETKYYDEGRNMDFKYEALEIKKSGDCSFLSAKS